MLVWILVAVAVVVLLFIAIAATRPAAYHVERKIDVAASPDAVFAVLNDLRRFAGVYVLFGTPLEKHDPAMDKIVDGPAAGVGQSYAWRGKGAGKGKMTIERSVSPQNVDVKVEFTEPMKSIAVCALGIASTSTGSTVTWSMDGKHNFIGKMFGLFIDMDKAIGGDIERGLAQLQSVLEPRA
jgi:hypothetical protein